MSHFLFQHLDHGLVQYSMSLNYTLIILPQRLSYYHYSFVSTQLDDACAYHCMWLYVLVCGCCFPFCDLNSFGTLCVIALPCVKTTGQLYFLCSEQLLQSPRQSAHRRASPSASGRVPKWSSSGRLGSEQSLSLRSWLSLGGTGYTTTPRASPWKSPSSPLVTPTKYELTTAIWLPSQGWQSSLY